MENGKVKNIKKELLSNNRHKLNGSDIFSNIQKHIILDDVEKERLSSIFKSEHFPKKKCILEQGAVCRKLYFVESGSLIAYNTNKEGKKSIIMFAIQDWWITDMYAFINQKSALLTLETIEDCRLLSVNFDILEKLLIDMPKLERFFRILFQKAYVREQLRVLNNISFTIEERYTRFIKEYPQIVEKITQKQIASYLGVTPEFLCAIKNNRSRS